MTTRSSGGRVTTPNRRPELVAHQDHRPAVHSATHHRQEPAAARRLDAAHRLPPLEDGVRDPWAARSGAEAVTADPYSALAYERMSDRQWRAACARLRALAEDGERHRRNRADLLRPRDDDYRGRGHLHHGLAA